MSCTYVNIKNSVYPYRLQNMEVFFSDLNCLDIIKSVYEWLKVIECLKKTGMRLKNIKTFIEMAMQGDDTIDERLTLIIKQQTAVKKQMEELQETLDTLNFKRWYYETAKRAATTAVPRNMTLEELPEEFREIRLKLRGE